MSEPVHTSETPATGAPAPTEPTTSTEPAPTPETPAEQKPTETVDYWKRMSRENEAKAKSNADAAKKLKEIEDRDLSELQKAQRDREDALARLTEMEQAALRYRVASEFSISKEDADEWLVGGDEEAVKRKAQRFVELRGQAAPPAPRPDPGQGARPNPPESEDDALYRQMFGTA